MLIVLGSKSARRKELLELMGLDFCVDAADVNEVVTSYRSPSDYVKKVALRKGKIVSQNHPDKLVISADTVVYVDEELLGKPKNKEEARKMIEMIQGKAHFVLTAVDLRYGNYHKIFSEKTKVVIDNMSSEEIEEYISSEEPYDKAGAYAIQGKFAKHIREIKGDYYNVMGLPINRLYNEIKILENKIKKVRI